MNKYERKPEHIIDLHGRTVREVKEILDSLCTENKYSHVRIITGKGLYREKGPVLRNFVMSYFDNVNILYATAKLGDGGTGALEIFFESKK